MFRDPLELTIDGCLAAIEHAGLTTADIDGLSTYPGPVGGLPNGFSGAGAYEMIDALRLNCGIDDAVIGMPVLVIIEKHVDPEGEVY